MNQLKIEQAKYKKPKPVTHKHHQDNSRNHNYHSQMIRLGLTLALVILIYKSVSSAQINYQEIVQNQKMFVVKDVRGVFPPLNGTISALMTKWRIVYFQTHQNLYMNKFENYTVWFSQGLLKVWKADCRTTQQLQWSNFSFNMEIEKEDKKNYIIQTASNQNNQQCDSNTEEMIAILTKTSVWTISDKYLYLLIQNDQTVKEGDYYLILEPASSFS